MKNTLKALFIGLGFVGLTAFVVRSENTRLSDEQQMKNLRFQAQSNEIMQEYRKQIQADNYEAIQNMRQNFDVKKHEDVVVSMAESFVQKYGTEIQQKISNLFKETYGSDYLKTKEDKERFPKTLVRMLAIYIAEGLKFSTDVYNKYKNKQ